MICDLKYLNLLVRMKQYLGNIEPMESLFSFMNNWLGITNRAIIAAYYFSNQKQKNILLRVNNDGIFKTDSYQEKFLHKTLQRNTTKNTYQSEDAGSFHNLFVEKFFESKVPFEGSPILIFPFINNEDWKKDFLFIQLPSNDKSKKVKAGNQIQLGILENNDLIDEITVVSKLIYNMQIDYREQFDSFKTLFLHKIFELDNAKAEVEQLKESKNKDKLQMAYDVLDLMVEKYEAKYKVESTAKRKIIETEVDNEKFKIALQNSYLNMLGLSEAEETIQINEDNLYFEAPSGLRKSKIGEGAKMKKAEKYLNDLETAAAVVYKEGGRLTSENIGRKCDPIKIPATISDYNRRHQERIRMLMINRPEDWPTIREFRPIINILTGSNPPEENKIAPGQNQ